MATLLALPAETTIVELPGGRAELRAGRHVVPIPSTSIRRALETLVAGAASEEELTQQVIAMDGSAALLALLGVLLDLADRRLLSCVLVEDGQAVVTACPVPVGLLGGEDAEPDARCWMLSRFAYVHREGETMLLETPLSGTRITVHDARLFPMFLHERPVRADEGTADGGRKRELLRLLGESGFLSEIDERGKPLEDARPELRAWEFHDLLFHASSRLGRHARPYGATDRLKGTVPLPPAIKPRIGARIVRLARPSLAAIERHDPPFTRVLERRRSDRDHDATPLTLDDLGRFLFRSSRVRKIERVGDVEVARRVYPGGGAAYELEIYVAVNRCKGLARGLYHYRPDQHSLSRLSGATPDVEALIEAAGRTQHSAPPHVLIILTARVQRLFWRYSGMAYAVILKDVGVLFQTWHLVAEAMGLAACALGGGNADLFATASGIDYYEEPSVGEFTLGRRVANRRPAVTGRRE